jgi:hypothetical protein
LNRGKRPRKIPLDGNRQRRGKHLNDTEKGAREHGRLT